MWPPAIVRYRIMMNIRFAWKCFCRNFLVSVYLFSSYSLSTWLNLQIFYLSVGKHVFESGIESQFQRSNLFVDYLLNQAFSLFWKYPSCFDSHSLLLSVYLCRYELIYAYLGHMESIKEYLNRDGQNIDHKLNIFFCKDFFICATKLNLPWLFLSRSPPSTCPYTRYFLFIHRNVCIRSCARPEY